MFWWEALRSRAFHSQTKGAAALGVLSMLASCATAPAATFAEAPLDARSGHFSVIGDLQGTLPEERLIWREDNALERPRLVSEMARTNPAFVVMLGDLVSWGGSAARWGEFDEHTAALRQMHIPVLPVPGNHDYYGGDRLRNYFARFPAIHGSHWYERRYGRLALVFLDSNAGPLGGSAWSEQKRWFDETLTRLDADPSILGVLVFLHHAPLTNSSLVGDDSNVLEAFVPSFQKRKKTMAMLTGHAHGYERFERSGKAFIVTAGGGGPRSPLLTGNARRHPDDELDGPPLRNFNFVELSVGSDGVSAFVVGLPKGSSSFCRLEKFQLPWPDHDTQDAPSAADPARAERELLGACYPP